MGGPGLPSEWEDQGLPLEKHCGIYAFAAALDITIEQCIERLGKAKSKILKQNEMFCADLARLAKTSSLYFDCRFCDAVTAELDTHPLGGYKGIAAIRMDKMKATDSKNVWTRLVHWVTVGENYIIDNGTRLPLHGIKQHYYELGRRSSDDYFIVGWGKRFILHSLIDLNTIKVSLDDEQEPCYRSLPYRRFCKEPPCKTLCSRRDFCKDKQMARIICPHFRDSYCLASAREIYREHCALDYCRCSCSDKIISPQRPAKNKKEPNETA